ncbi:hypothetical protein Tco_0515246 [Tanacetum coccineum]
MDKSRSFLIHDKHQALYDALFNSLNLDDAIVCGEVDAKKVLRKRDRDDEDPSAGPNHEEPVEEPAFEMASNDVVNDADQPSDDPTQAKDKDSKKDWFKQPPRHPTPDQE